MNQTWENGKTSSFGPDFGLLRPKFGPQKLFLWALPLLDVIHCCKLSLYAISRKTIFLEFCLSGGNSGRHFFSKNLAFSDTWYHGQLSSRTISEKTNDPVLKTLSDRRTYGQTGESGFIGRCPTNVERPIEKCLTKKEAARFQLGRVNHLRNYSSSAQLWLCFRFFLTKSCNMRLKAVGNST